jgi:hypothetical protein
VDAHPAQRAAAAARSLERAWTTGVGKPEAGAPPVRCDVAGGGHVATLAWCPHPALESAGLATLPRPPARQASTLPADSVRSSVAPASCSS